tara:strand:+ start:580 stop:1383 length:804 start_codon:yes stop_codon:yes gene_type:complete
MSNFCAPDRVDNYNKYNSCLNKNEINSIANKLDISPTKSYKNKIKKIIKSNKDCNDEYCVLDKKNLLKTDEAKMAFKPIHPTDNKYEWLSNFDMNDVMEQYERKYTNFKFLGSVPIDFWDIYSRFKNFDFLDYFNKKKNKFGVIFNLDPSHKGGSHWVSLYFECTRKNCDISFIDSGGDDPEKEIKRFMNHIVDNANKYRHRFNYNKMNININNVDMQKKDSECGVYCLYFITQRLKGKTFNQLIDKDLSDEKMNKYREHFFNKITV